MMRILIPFVAALGLSLGVSTGIIMMRAPAHVAADATAKKDSTHADSGTTAKDDSTHQNVVHADSTRADSGVAAGATTGAAAHGDSAAPPASLASAAVSADAHGAPAKGLVPATATREIPAHNIAQLSATVARSDSIEKRVAKVFAVMQSRDAAHILQQMDDGDVKTILASLSAKQQAAILGQFPAQRAATLTRAALRGEGDQ
jgi:hypothetical protein